MSWRGAVSQWRRPRRLDWAGCAHTATSRSGLRHRYLRLSILRLTCRNLIRHSLIFSSLCIQGCGLLSGRKKRGRFQTVLRISQTNALCFRGLSRRKGLLGIISNRGFVGYAFSSAIYDGQSGGDRQTE